MHQENRKELDMVHFFVGIKAQFIKIAPTIIEMKNRNIPFRHIDSGQHAELTRLSHRIFGPKEPDISLYDKNKGTSIVRR